MLLPFQGIRDGISGELRQGDEKLNAMFNNAAVSFAAGQLLVDAGRELHVTYRLRRGWAARTRRLADGRIQHILLFLPGDVFALKSLFVARQPDDIEALSSVEVAQVNHRDLHRACERDTDVALRCLWQVMEEERQLHNWIVGLGCADALERICAFVLRLRGRLASGGVIAPDSWSFEIPMTQSQLGAFLGLSLVHVNKSLMKLRDNGLLAVRGRVFTILDHRRLVALGGPLLDPLESDDPAYGGEGAERDRP